LIGAAVRQVHGLNLISASDRPHGGTVRVNVAELTLCWTRAARTRFRRELICFIFQFFQLSSRSFTV
jgi:ABC-type lipoprotein export system ATPase subunit